MGHSTPGSASFGWAWQAIRIVLANLCWAAIVVYFTGQAQAQSFSTGANFTTITRSQTNALAGIIEPPDTMGAAGPNHFVAFNNGSFSVFNKNGAIVSQVSDTSFWISALGSDPGGLSDPRILYDPASQRWFAAMITTDQATNNKILFARSNTSDPTQGFKAVSYTTTNNRFADFPTLGLDANGVYVGTNNFNSAGTTLRSLAIYSVPKIDLLAATPSLSRITASHNTLGTTNYGFTFQPAVDYGPKAASAPEPIVSTSNGSFGVYKVATLTGTTNSGATLSSSTSKTVQSTSNPTNSSQPGTSTTIDNGDDRFSASVMQVGNFLYAVHNISVSGRSAVRWTIADATTFSVVQQGTISSPTLSYFFPSIAVNAIGDAVVGFSGSNSSTFASTYAAAGISAGGVPGGALTFGTPVQTEAGTDFYPDTRWGDYSAATPDPADPGVFWTHQEYAANRFTIGGTTYGNWATQASEIIPTKAGERRWSNSAGGNFATGANYFTGAAPVASDHVIFSRPSASYTVTFSNISSGSDRASVRQGNVTWDLSAATSYSLANTNAATPSLTVGGFQGTAALTVLGGVLHTSNATIGGGPGGSGAVTAVGATQWINSGLLSVGTTGPGTLTIQDGSDVDSGTSLLIGSAGTVNLGNARLRFDGYSRAAGSTLNFTSGTVQVVGNRTIDTDPAIADWFGSTPSIGPAKMLSVDGSATLSNAKPFTLSGGTLSASLTMTGGSHLVVAQGSEVIGPVTQLAGSTIDATGGNLGAGSDTATNGFYGNGTLIVGSNSVTLLDDDAVVFDSAALVTLGSASGGGSVLATRGMTLNSGGHVTGHGTIDTPNVSFLPLTNSGAITGSSLAEPLTLTGYVKGTGTLDGVAFTGTFSPGLSTASVNLGSAEYDGALEIEIGGLLADIDYDQINHNIGSGVAQLGGTLNVSLLNSFMPQSGDAFDILTAVGGVSGTFASMVLPALSGNLFWNIIYGSNSIELAVATASLPGDFDANGVVDAADYAVWRKGLGSIYTQDNYDVWRANFGQTSGAGSSLASAKSQLAVPEPAASTCLLMALAVTRFWRRLKMAG
jgi:T5SS/PEP-CTERM-associated repeat protein